jgi:hypothetical protein
VQQAINDFLHIWFIADQRENHLAIPGGNFFGQVGISQVERKSVCKALNLRFSVIGEEFFVI